MRHSLIILISAIILCGIASCKESPILQTLTESEELMESHPDSAMVILKAIDESNLNSDRDKAKYALLMSMALDKNYVDTTTFKVLQQAIDFYLKKGSPDEQLKTLYYQGRIYQNKRDWDNAIDAFNKGLDLTPMVKDSLYIARTLVAQASVLHDLYDFEGYIDNHKKAARIYHNLSDRTHEFDCLINILNGANILNNKECADSAIQLCDQFKSLDDAQRQSLQEYKLTYVSTFGTKAGISEFLNSMDKSLGFTITGLFNLAYAYNIIGNNEEADALLEYIKESDSNYDAHKYKAIHVAILDSIGDYKDAYEEYCSFSKESDSINWDKFDRKSRLLNEKHKIELCALKDAKHKSDIITWCIIGIVILAMGIIILVLIARSNKSQKKLALQKAKNTELENSNLKVQKHNLALENTNLILERDNAALETENLSIRVKMLEQECDNLKELSEISEEIPSEVKKAIHARIGKLNSILASYISSNGRLDKSYETLVKEMAENSGEFMNETRLAFKMTHPTFIKYFEDHGLSVREINYVCLYAIGLRGKEIGLYMKMPSHVNMSSAIRKKLGIGKHDTNLGIYVRNLLNDL